MNTAGQTRRDSLIDSEGEKKKRGKMYYEGGLTEGSLCETRKGDAVGKGNGIGRLKVLHSS